MHEDPDRLTTPLVRRNGELVEVTSDEAFEEIDRRLPPLLAEHGPNSVAVCLGNPVAHSTPGSCRSRTAAAMTRGRADAGGE